MRKWIAHLLCGAELDELERWRVHYQDTRQWLAEFPDARAALEALYSNASPSAGGTNLRVLRDHMRARRKLARVGLDPAEPLHVVGESNPDMLAAIRAAWDSPDGTAHLVDGRPARVPDA